MERSSSDSALVSAGVKMSHVPRRATQHSVFLPGYEILPSDLKVGQASLTRQVYQEEARRLEDTYLNADRPAHSTYGTEISLLLTPEAYKNPTQPIKQQDPPGGYGHHKVSHWKSTALSTHSADALHGAKYHRQHGPSYQAANPPTCVSSAMVDSTYTEFHGRYGSNPRHRIHPDADRMPVFRTLLTVGTAKGTNHIPGYQGFLASNTSNPHVARVESGVNLRSVDKTNLTEQFHANLLNYSGHVPVSPHNGPGARRADMESVYGRSFQTPKLGAFDG